MARHIENAETDRLACELAAAAGESLTDAARQAFEARLEGVRAHASAGAVTLDDIIARARSLPVLDDRSADDIVGYDAKGRFET